MDLDSQKDKRQFEFASTSRNQRLELIRERDSFLRKLVWAFVAGIGCIALIMFGVYLFGNAEQQEAAATVLRYGFVAVAGGGAFITLSPVVKAFASKS